MASGVLAYYALHAKHSACATHLKYAADLWCNHVCHLSPHLVIKSRSLWASCVAEEEHWIEQVSSVHVKLTVCCADLHVQHCNDFFSVGNGAWSAISCVKSLKRLAIEDLHCRLDTDSLKELATMTQVSRSSHY